MEGVRQSRLQAHFQFYFVPDNLLALTNRDKGTKLFLKTLKELKIAVDIAHPHLVVRTEGLRVSNQPGLLGNFEVKLNYVLRKYIRDR